MVLKTELNALIGAAADRGGARVLLFIRIFGHAEGVHDEIEGIGVPVNKLSQLSAQSFRGVERRLHVVLDLGVAVGVELLVVGVPARPLART